MRIEEDKNTSNEDFWGMVKTASDNNKAREEKTTVETVEKEEEIVEQATEETKENPFAAEIKKAVKRENKSSLFRRAHAYARQILEQNKNIGKTYREVFSAILKLKLA